MVIKHVRQNKPESGFSVVELMIAMTIGLILITGMISVFSGNQRSAELNQAMTNMQEGARFAIDAIARDARMAGFQGCLDLNTAAAEPRANNAPTTNLYASATTGSVIVSATNWDPAPPPTFTIPTGSRTPIAGTHSLTLQFGSPDRAQLSSPMTTISDDVTIKATDDVWGLAGDEIMLIANCDAADLFRISSITTAGTDLELAHGAADNNGFGVLTAAYGKETYKKAELMLFTSNVYFIANTGLSNDAGDPIRALYRQSLPYDAPPVELIQGIENLRIRFGVRQSDNTLRYFLPNAAGLNPGDIESLQVGILMSSWDHAASNPDEQTYVLAGQDIEPETNITDANASGLKHAADNRLRLAFNTTIKIRNRR